MRDIDERGMRTYRVDEMYGNSFNGTEHWQNGPDGKHEICFLLSDDVSLSIGDVVEKDDNGNVYKNGVLILDRVARAEKLQRLYAEDCARRRATGRVKELPA